MATKAKKAASTPSGSNISGANVSSPLSPTRHSRLQEKVELQNLNDRLANYIERVRYLETENNRLNREISTSQETTVREIQNIHTMYDNELTEARKLLDETHKEKAKLEIETKRLWDANEELKRDLDKKKKDLSIAQNDCSLFESRFNDIQVKYNQALVDAKKMKAELRDLEKDRDRFRNIVEDLRKQLEEESLARVDVENSNQSLREELTFKEQVFQKQITETRTRRQIEISEIDGKLSEEYEQRLQQALQDLRDQYEAQIHNNRAEIESLYETKIRNLQNSANLHSDSAATNMEELQNALARINVLNQRIAELEAQNAALSTNFNDLQKQTDFDRRRYLSENGKLEAEIHRMAEENARQLQDYHDLMDIKIALDIEIATYRKLLESEEHRLNISPSGTPESRIARGSSQRRTPVRAGGKRKRTLLEESEGTSMNDYTIKASASGDVEISEICPDGKYVRLHNKSNKDIALSGWQIIRRAGDNETQYKLHRTVKLEAGATVTVWSSDVGQDHEPPTNIVMKGQKWFVSDNMTTVLLNNNNEEVAQLERTRKLHSSSILRRREGSAFLGSEELHHQHGDPQGEEKCRIM